MVVFIPEQASLQDYNVNSPYTCMLRANASWIIFRLIYITAWPIFQMPSVHLQRYKASEYLCLHLFCKCLFQR